MIPKQMECILLIIMYNCSMIDNCEEAFILSKNPSDKLDRVSVPSPIATNILMDAMARDRAHMYLFSV